MVGDEDVAGSQISNLGSSNAPANLGAGGSSQTVPSTTNAATAGTNVLDDFKQSALEEILPGVETLPLNSSPPPPIAAAPPPPAAATPPAAVSLTLPGAWSGRLSFADIPDLGYESSLSFTNGTIQNGVFSALKANFLTPPALDLLGPVEAGTFSLSQFSGLAVTGSGTLFPGNDFIVYEFEIDGSGERSFIWAGLPTPAAAFPTSGVRHYTLRPDYVLDSGVPFVRGVSGASGLPEGEGGAFIDWGADGPPSFAGWRIAIQGSGTAQNSAIGMFVGQVFDPGVPTSAKIEADMRGTARDSSSENEATFGYSAFAVTDRAGSAPGGNAFYGTGAPDNFTLVTGEGAAQEFQTGVAGDAAEFRPAVVAASTTRSTGSRTLSTMYGYSGGAAQHIDDEGVDSTYLFQNSGLESSYVSPGGIFPGDISLYFDPTTGTLEAYFELLDLEDDHGNDIDVYFGCSDSPCTAGDTSFYLDDATFAAIEDPDELESNRFGVFLPSVAVTDAKFYLVTSNFFDSEGFLPSGVSLCDCEYVTWGFWGGSLIDDVNDRNARVHLATWVAGGDICGECTLPTNQTATYQGHLIGTVRNGGDLYLAAGGYEQVVQFSTGNAYTYDIQITNFDGQNFSGSEFGTSGGNFGYEIISGGKRLVAYGSFNGGGGDSSAEILGGFRIREDSEAPDYEASGIIAAKKVSSVPIEGGE